ncbi:Uncharacterized protein TCM_039080 [Theobroma cacao]|uniref:Uncharacterized protein n=1 Tax=Theobroma cacao TaxID=3641 RepID=A0A061GXI1_THECC|nr:Uncharacterized protein TCM_039080 [Theobroma cacao]
MRSCNIQKFHLMMESFTGFACESKLPLEEVHPLHLSPSYVTKIFQCLNEWNDLSAAWTIKQHVFKPLKR